MILAAKHIPGLCPGKKKGWFNTPTCKGHIPGEEEKYEKGESKEETVEKWRTRASYYFQKGLLGKIRGKRKPVPELLRCK